MLLPQKPSQATHHQTRVCLRNFCFQLKDKRSPYTATSVIHVLSQTYNIILYANIMLYLVKLLLFHILFSDDNLFLVSSSHRLTAYDSRFPVFNEENK